MPSLSDFKRYFPDSFIMNLPKDIVSGDFFWAANKNGKIVLAVADCTGHGVPGAMISVACANILNKSLKELGLSKPSDILDKTTELVIEAFSVSENEQTYIKDGMDIALCAIEKGGEDNVTIEFENRCTKVDFDAKIGVFENRNTGTTFEVSADVFNPPSFLNYFFVSQSFSNIICRQKCNS